ncbi:MAG: prephenate dehydratase [Gammaproteobacteria bacterium]|nr:prephenate dehydratase [Gammaproteobacteria bacterium]
MSKDNTLENLRRCIDQIDAQVEDLISERVRLAQRIAELKREGGEACYYRPDREARVLRQVIERNKGPLSDQDMARLFREIMSASLAAEAQVTVGYLGPEGTYTQSAALKHFGRSVQTQPLATIPEVFGVVEKGQAQFGVVPVENSTEGVVTHTLDMFMDSTLQICGEVHLRIHHQLIGKGESLAGIERVLAHSQSFAQCRRWLAQHLANAEAIAVTSNAEAAKRITNDVKAAAIASSAAAEFYHLNVLSADIEDDPGNTTRFLVIGNTRSGPSGHDKTSLLVSSPNKPGALYRLLRPLAEYGVSMTRIESRPSRKGAWDYVFFIDLEGHADDPGIAPVLEELKQEAAFVKLLGAYPQAVL